MKIHLKALMPTIAKALKNRYSYAYFDIFFVYMYFRHWQRKAHTDVRIKLKSIKTAGLNLFNPG